MQHMMRGISMSDSTSKAASEGARHIAPCNIIRKLMLNGAEGHLDPVEREMVTGYLSKVVDDSLLASHARKCVDEMDDYDLAGFVRGRINAVLRGRKAAR